jgi:hypothetical protein
MNNGMTPFLYTLAVNTHFMTVPLGIVLPLVLNSIKVKLVSIINPLPYDNPCRGK